MREKIKLKTDGCLSVQYAEISGTSWPWSRTPQKGNIQSIDHKFRRDAYGWLRIVVNDDDLTGIPGR